VNNVQVSYSIQIYTDLQNLSDPASGTPAFDTPQTGVTFYQGYYTVDLTKPVRIYSGEYYSVVITLGGKDKITYFVEATYDYGFVKAVACTAPNQSFADVNGDGSWKDLHDSGKSARIKAFTIDTTDAAELAEPMIRGEAIQYNGVKLTWNKVSGAKGYEVERSSDGDYKVVDTIAGGSNLTYTASDLTLNQSYTYRIRAYSLVNREKVYGGYSNEQTIKTKLDAPVIASITSVGYSSVKLTWSKVTGAEGYHVYQAASQGGTYALAQDITTGGTTACTRGGLSTGRTYYFKVLAYRYVNGIKVYSGNSAVKTGKTVLNTTKLSTASKSYNSIKLSWNKVAGANGYQILRGISKTSVYTTVKTITNSNTLTYTNGSRTTGRTYYYKIRAYRLVNGAKVYSGYSEVKSAAAKPSAAAFTSVKKTAAHAITLKWKKISGASGYVIYRADGKNGSYKKVKTITRGSTLSYKNGSLKKGTYYYKIRAYRTVNKKKVYGSYSPVKYAKIP